MIIDIVEEEDNTYFRGFPKFPFEFSFSHLWRSLASRALFLVHLLRVRRLLTLRLEHHIEDWKSVSYPSSRAKSLICVIKNFTHLAVLVEIHLQRLDVLFESESAHRPQKVVTVDGFTLFTLTFVAGLTRDEADELRDALLNGLFRVFGDFRVRG